MSSTQTITYGTVTKTFHWLTALLILTVFPLGAIANQLPYETNEQLALKAQLFSYHKTLGIIVFLVALARILWAIGQPKPGSIHPERKAETTLAALVHWLLYISLVAVPLTGWIHHAATEGFAPHFLPISQDLPFVPDDAAVAKFFGGLHWVWSKIMMAAILLHVAGALKHQFIDRDATLRRMWFGKSDCPDVGAYKGSKAAPIAALAIYALVTSAGAAAGMYSAERVTFQTELAQVSSEWAVSEGEIALTITQFGNQVTGNFGEWTSAISFDENATGTMGNVETTIAIGSLSLGTVTNDALGTDFFNAEAFPTAVFSADIMEAESGFIAEGTLTIKESTVPVSLPFSLTIEGDIATMMGQITLDRRDFQIGDTLSDESNLAFAVIVEVNLMAVR